MSRKHKKPIDTTKRGKFSEALEGILSQISLAFVKELKMDPEQARKAAEVAVEMIRENAGGGVLYVAKGHLWAITETHRRIYSRFNGSNHFQLAKEFNLTERQIYAIVARCQEEKFNKEQTSFGY